MLIIRKSRALPISQNSTLMCLGQLKLIADTGSYQLLSTNTAVCNLARYTCNLSKGSWLMNLLKEFAGSLLLLAVYIATAPMLANHQDASECAKTIFDVDTVGEYLPWQI